MNRMFNSLSGAFIISFFIGSISWAQEIRENYNGIRSLGMGGASIAVVNDETALLSNPAALGKLRETYGTILDPEIEASSNVNGMYTTKAITNPWELEDVKNTTDASRGKYYHFKGQIFPSIVTTNFGIGIHAKKLMDAQMSDDGTNLKTFYQDDMALHLGANLRLFSGRMKIGFVGKGISRIEIDKDINPVTDSMSLSAHAKEGFGIGMDAGLILAAPIVLLPTLSAVVRDVGGTQFTSGSGLRMSTTERPQSLDQDIDVAFAVFPIHGNNSRSSFTVEYQKIKKAADYTDKTKFYHVGYEFNKGDALFFRAGMNQKYWTAGVELATESTQIQIASYGEDIGTDGASIEDRRYVFKFAWRF